MRQSPLFMGVTYCILGVLFTFFAIQNVSQSGWGFFTYFLIALATMDFASGIRFVMLHRQIKRNNVKK